MAAIEWFDPVFVAGHWTPQLVDLAGGIDVLGFAGEHSEQSTWEIGGRRGAARGGRHAVRLRRRALARGGRAPTPTRCATVGAERVVAVDASAYFSRPGPRLVDGLELMAHILHPDLVPEPVGRGPRGRGLSARHASRRLEPSPLAIAA